MTRLAAGHLETPSEVERETGYPGKEAQAKQACPFKVVSLPCPLPAGDPCPPACLPPSQLEPRRLCPPSSGRPFCLLLSGNTNLDPLGHSPQSGCSPDSEWVRHQREPRYSFPPPHRASPTWSLIPRARALTLWGGEFPKTMPFLCTCFFALLSSLGIAGSSFPGNVGMGWRWGGDG